MRTRKKKDPAPSLELWPHIQDRYPIPTQDEDGDHFYKLRDHLSDDEIDFNLSRMKAEIETKQKHHDELAEFKMHRRAMRLAANSDVRTSSPFVVAKKLNRQDDDTQEQPT